jgi:hypothetical protein
MQLETYIKDLLYRYECVIVPGFGAFLAHYKSAMIDGTTHTFYPPSKHISFNRQLQTNDGLLANYIATADQCSYETALQRIRHATAGLLSKLNGGEEIVLKGIGDFRLNTEGGVQFVPSGSENFNTASFGLTSFTTPEINREVVLAEDRKLEEAPLLFSPQRRSIAPYLKYAAVGLIAVTIGGLGGMKIYEGEVQKHNFAEKQKANALVEGEIQEATFVFSNPLPALKITVPKQHGRYHIVAGAFRVEENAHKKMQQLLEKGYHPQFIGKNKYGLHQVIYSSHEKRSEALDALRTIQRTENKDAWLLVKELTSE